MSAEPASGAHICVGILDKLCAPTRGLEESNFDADELKTAAESLAPPFRPLHSSDGPTFASTGCSTLDEALGGGFHLGIGAVVEIAGRAGSGKTQLGIQAALAAASASPASYAIYCLSGGRFPTHRAREVALLRFCEDKSSVERLMGRVVVETVQSPTALESWAAFRLPYLLRETRARVVVVDALAAVFRHELVDARERATALVRTAQSLAAAVRQVDGVILCINEVTQRLDSDFSRRSEVVPAMGHAWDVSVSMRVFLERHDDSMLGSRRRSIRLVHAPHVPPSDEPTDVVIDASGIHGDV